MAELTLFSLLFLVSMSFVAGLVDAAVGGGGLIQTPALFSALPNHTPATIFGTNKLSSIFGTATAAFRYARTVRIHWPVALPAALAALVASFIGARLVAWLPVQYVKPMVLVLLVLIALYTMKKKNLGDVHAPLRSGRAERWLAILTGTVIGFYDGFFGPGTGSFLTFAFVRFFGFDFLRAAATTKVVNGATNLAALAYFIPTGNVLYAAAIPMAIANILGAQLGAHVAMKGGTQFVRKLFLVLCWVLIAKFAYDMLR
ncbi:TSUP family transporter [Chitinivorax sp. B]|uniref:sulfite exporter TauE/SafE family protein n=1 Tax=Chitinivorax sp. B TaxID=2502235 RepID=UPI0010F4ACCC|nr:TSUP family transporter [Chitinivorax sp. B]